MEDGWNGFVVMGAGLVLMGAGFVVMSEWIRDKLYSLTPFFVTIK